eukprot:COSAG06_NODE_3404_length_5394_cov_6.648914_1_plen_55_part_10
MNLPRPTRDKHKRLSTQKASRDSHQTMGFSRPKCEASGAIIAARSMPMLMLLVAM